MIFTAGLLFLLTPVISMLLTVGSLSDEFFVNWLMSLTLQQQLMMINMSMFGWLLLAVGVI